MDERNRIDWAATLTERCHPHPTALLDSLRPQIDDTMLVEIAAADYGMDADEHLAALRRIHAGEAIPTPIGWEPREVLELIRWSEPEDPNWKPGATGRRGHLMRAFCCDALLRAGAEPANQGYLSGENQTLIQLIASVLTLGAEATEAALRLVSWRMMRVQPDDEERPFFALGLLLLAVACRRNADDGAFLAELCDWVLAEERQIRAMPQIALPRASEAWMFGLTFFNSRDTVWRAVAWRLLVEPPTALPAAAAESLFQIAMLLDASEGR